MGIRLAILLLILAFHTTVFAQTSTPKVFHADRTSTADGNTLIIGNYSTVGVKVKGTGTFTITFEVKGFNSTEWDALQCKKTSDGSESTTATADGSWQCAVAGFGEFRTRVSGCTGCSVTSTGYGTTAVSGRSGGGSGVASSITGLTTLPAEPCTVGQVYAAGDSNNAAFYFCPDGTWVEVGAVESDTMQSVFDRGKAVTNANSADNAAKWLDATGRGTAIYTDATDGPQIQCVEANVVGGCTTYTRKLAAGQSVVVKNSSGTAIYTLTEAGVLTLNSTLIRTSYSFPVTLNPRGAATGAYESIVSNLPTEYYLTLTDANTDAADFTFDVTAEMAGKTLATFRLIGVSKNASPSGNIDLDCAMSSYTPGTDTFAAHVTTGEQTALLTPATQNRAVAVTTSAHTINGGALVAGDVVYGSCEVDATATTSAQMTDFRLRGYVLITLQ